MAIYERLKSRNATLFAADLPANRPASPELAAVSSTIDGSGLNSSSVAGELGRPGSWQKILLESLACSFVTEQLQSNGSPGKWKPWATKYALCGCAPLMWAHPIRGAAFSLWPTPTASDAKRRAPETADGKLDRGAHTGWCLVDVTGFSPHPEFIEWLMGFPIGWTEHPLSVTQLSLELPPQLDAQL